MAPQSLQGATISASRAASGGAYGVYAAGRTFGGRPRRGRRTLGAQRSAIHEDLLGILEQRRPEQYGQRICWTARGVFRG